jgi:hypothetical protein
MKNRLMLGWISILVSLGAGCMEDQAALTAVSPTEAPPAVADGAPLSTEQRAALEANPELQALREQLAKSGEQIRLDEATVFQQDDKEGILAPVSGPDGETLEHAQVVVRQQQGRPARISLELAPTSSPATGELRDDGLEAAGLSCGGWTNWYPVFHYCDWAVACWFGDATYNVVERERWCCADGTCLREKEVSEQRAKCGC